MKKLYWVLPRVLFIVCTLATPCSEEPKTQRESRLDIISYGIETELISLVEALEKEDNKEFTPELTALFSSTRSVGVRESILTLFSNQAVDTLKDWTESLLQDPWEERSSTVILALSYASKLSLKECAPSVRALLETENTQFRGPAIAALGKIGGTEDAAFLSDMLDDEISGDEKQRLVTRQAIMTALAELKDPSQWDRFLEIAENEDENGVIRATAAKALAAIGGDRAYDALAKIYESTDPVLREAALSGAAKLEGRGAETLISDGLRDSYYKVRIQALASAKEKKLDGITPLVLYRAKTDPVESVRDAAYETLAVLGNKEGLDWLSSLVNDEKATDARRVKAAKALSQYQKDIAWSVIPTVARKALSDDKKTWLRYELGKIVASAADSRYADLALEYLSHKDTLTRSLGLDMYEKQRYASVKSRIETIAEDDKQGALQKRAKTILEKDRSIPPASE